MNTWALAMGAPALSRTRPSILPEACAARTDALNANARTASEAVRATRATVLTQSGIMDPSSKGVNNGAAQTLLVTHLDKCIAGPREVGGRRMTRVRCRSVREERGPERADRTIVGCWRSRPRLVGMSNMPGTLESVKEG